MKLLLHSTWNGIDWLFPPFLQEWSVHSITAGMEWCHSIPAGMEWSFHSSGNVVVIPFQQEWNDSIPFLQDGGNNQSIPFQVEWS